MIEANEPIAIFAGKGLLPKILIEDCQKKGRKFLLFLLESENYDIDYAAFNPIKIQFGAIANFLEILQQNNIKNLVFIGSITKPDFSSIKVDKKGALLLAKILANKILGDDAVLRSVINFFEKENLKILKIDDLLDCVLTKKEILTILKPNNYDIENIDIAKKAIRALSEFDIGQSLIIAQKQIIAIEAVEGTDEMIKRCANLKIDFKQNAILVKIKKHHQSKKADLPTIGVETIKNCYASQIKGIAVQAGSTLIVNREETIKTANELGIFLIAI